MSQGHKLKYFSYRFSSEVEVPMSYLCTIFLASVDDGFGKSFSLMVSAVACTFS